jgi:hypothetical protein
MAARRIPLKYKIIAYIATWLVALFATNPNGKYWPLIYMFPLGLAAFVNYHSGGWSLLAACIGIYLAHAYFYFRTRKVWSTLLLFGGLVALLICNVSGCRAMLNTH